MIASGSAISASTMAITNPIIGIVLTSSSALLTSIAFLINNEAFSKGKRIFTTLRDWIIVFALVYEKTLNETMVEKKIDEKEAQDLKKKL